MISTNYELRITPTSKENKMTPMHSAQPTWSTRLAAEDKSLRVHLLGIGGSGLAPIATVLHETGFVVSGSDAQTNPRTDALAAQGVVIYPSQIAANLVDHPQRRPDVVLISSAVAVDNPERAAAEALGIPIAKRRDFLPALLAQRQVIAIAGTHGKSTTTAMIVRAFQECSVDAGYIVGAELPEYGSAHAGSSPYFIIEADEYDYMFLGLTPSVAVVTNVEWDHPDCFPTPQDFHNAFVAFTDQVVDGGLLVTCGDDAGAEALRVEQSGKMATLSYGLGENADLSASAVVAVTQGGYSAQVSNRGTTLGVLSMQVPGLHNLRNGLAAVAVGHHCGLPVDALLAAIGSYQGVARRFELKGEVNGVTVIDDYAHNPTKVRATLAAARARFGDRRIWAVVQPHTYSRTRALLHEMAASFDDADCVRITDIYAARERDDGSISAADLVAASPHPQIKHVSGLEAMADHLAVAVRPGDVVLVLGAGTSYRIGELLLDRLRAIQPVT